MSSVLRVSICFSQLVLRFCNEVFYHDYIPIFFFFLFQKFHLFITYKNTSKHTLELRGTLKENHTGAFLLISALLWL